MKIYKKQTFVFALALLSAVSARAASGSPAINCRSASSSLTFRITPRNNSIYLFLNKRKYILPLMQTWVDTDGLKWSRYFNNEIAVNTTYPYDNYFTVETISFSDKPVVIAVSFCN